MKNVISRALLVLTATLFMSSFALAKSVERYFPTDITVNNYSSSNIVVQVPALNYYLLMLHHSTVHVTSHDFLPKRVILSRMDGSLMFAGDVDNHHVFNVVDYYNFKSGTTAKLQ